MPLGTVTTAWRWPDCTDTFTDPGTSTTYRATVCPAGAAHRRVTVTGLPLLTCTTSNAGSDVHCHGWFVGTGIVGVGVGVGVGDAGAVGVGVGVGVGDAPHVPVAT